MMTDLRVRLNETYSCIQEALLINEGQQGDALPSKALAVDVHSKGLGVEVQDGRVRVCKELLILLRQCVG